MSDHDALLAAVIAHPAEDTPRLMYADCIEETEPERAEFIRVQVEIARSEAAEPDAPDPQFEVMWRAGYRHRRHRKESVMAAFLGDRPCRCILCLKKRDEGLRLRADDWVPRVNALWDWHRGFVRAITDITAADWLEHADAIRAIHPVTRVRLTSAIHRVVPGNSGNPIARLLDEHHGYQLASDDAEGEERAVRTRLAERWPGVEFEFELPAAENGFARIMGQMILDAVTEQYASEPFTRPD